ncbi:Uncharacterised protein [Pseudomonas aeruginosa]|nr:Uncharacterised protein [Pseudomonas aeruginosa]
MRSCISVFRPALLALFVSASGSAGADAAVETRGSAVPPISMN